MELPSFFILSPLLGGHGGAGNEPSNMGTWTRPCLFLGGPRIGSPFSGHLSLPGHPNFRGHYSTRRSSRPPRRCCDDAGGRVSPRELTELSGQLEAADLGSLLLHPASSVHTPGPCWPCGLCRVLCRLPPGHTVSQGHSARRGRPPRASDGRWLLTQALAWVIGDAVGAGPAHTAGTGAVLTWPPLLCSVGGLLRDG